MYGPPKEALSDNGSAFIDETFNDLAAIAGMKMVHPQAGDKERTAIVKPENKEVRRHFNNIMNELFMNDRWSLTSLNASRLGSLGLDQENLASLLASRLG